MKNTKPQQNEMLTVEAAAERLGVQPATVRAWIFRREHLEFVKVGRSVRIPELAVERFVQTHTVPPGIPDRRSDPAAKDVRDRKTT